MSIFRLLVLITLFPLFACSPVKPEMYTTAVPAGPLIHYLEQRRHSFSSLKGLARVEIDNRGRKRVFESVGIVVDGQRRFRLEAYGPLGQSLMALVWNGKDVLMRLPDEDKVVHTGPAGLEDLLGQGLEPSELCDVLSGNIPEIGASGAAFQRCNEAFVCVFELRNGDSIRRVKLSYSAPESAQSPQILSYELQRLDKLLFQARFNRAEEIAHYLLPMQIIIESPVKKLQLTIEYTDVELNAPVSDDLFTLPDGTEGTRG